MKSGIILVAALLPLLAVAGPEKNLVVNGGLEEGREGTADGWSALDGLVTRRIKREDGRGYCLRMDTSVLQSEKKAWLENPAAYRPHSGPRGQYSTVGAHEGAWAWASPVDLEKNWRYYVLSVDVRCLGSKASPKVLVRGYRRITEKTAGQNSSWFHEHHPGGPSYSEQFGTDSQRRSSRAGDYLMVYRHTLHCHLTGPETWQHFELGIRLPSVPSAMPERLLLKPYAFWPNDLYEFDNLKLRKASREEVEKMRRKRPPQKNSRKKKMNASE